MSRQPQQSTVHLLHRPSHGLSEKNTGVGKYRSVFQIRTWVKGAGWGTAVSRIHKKKLLGNPSCGSQISYYGLERNPGSLPSHTSLALAGCSSLAVRKAGRNEKPFLDLETSGVFGKQELVLFATFTPLFYRQSEIERHWDLGGRE